MFVRLYWGVFLTVLMLTACSPNAEQAEPKNFTTQGKPTKTFETPWGPKEIYDPVQDEEVRKAFERLYGSNNTVVTSHGGPFDQSTQPVHGVDGEILRKARKSLMFQLMREKVCRGILDASCTRYRSFCKTQQLVEKNQWPECERKEMSLGVAFELFLDADYKKNPLYAGVPNPRKGIVIYEIDNTKTTSTDFKTLGKISLQSLNDQFDSFFSYNCHQPSP